MDTKYRLLRWARARNAWSELRVEDRVKDAHAQPHENMEDLMRRALCASKEWGDKSYGGLCIRDEVRTKTSNRPGYHFSGIFLLRMT